MRKEEIQDILIAIADERDKYKSIVEKASKDLNITPEMLIAEFDRLEDLEDDREQLKWRLKEERKKNKELTKKYKYAKEMYIIKDNSLTDYIHRVKEIINVIRNRNYNDYISAQDGNEVKEKIMFDIQELLEE